MGRSDREMHAAIEAHLGRALPSDWHEEMQKRYRQAYAAELTPVEGVLEALDGIMLPTCVASSATHAHLRYTLGLTGLYERFAGRIFSAEDVAAGKPAPDLFLYAAERMGAKPPACVVIEDSRPGVEAARAAGMRVLAFAGGLAPVDALEGPDTIVFDDMRELQRFWTPSDERIADGARDGRAAGRAAAADRALRGRRPAGAREWRPRP